MAANQQTIAVANLARDDLRLVVNGTIGPVEREYVGIIERTSRELARLLQAEAEALAAGTTLSTRTITEKARLQSIVDGARTGLAAAGNAAEVRLVNAATGELLPLAYDYTTGMVATQLGPTAWGATVNPTTVAAVVARTEARARYLRDVSANTVGNVERALQRGVLMGDNPRLVAQRLTAIVRQALTAAGHSALRIMRTEMLDTYRNADLAVREANADVLQGWEWHSAADERTCVSCWAMHGEQFPNTVPGPDDHPNGRCVAVPVVLDRLAFDLPPAPSRDQLFARLTPSQQLQVLGPTRARLLAEGMPWSRFSRQMPASDVWRAYRVATPVSQL